MYDHKQNSSSLIFATANKTNKKSHFYNHKQKDSKKRLLDVIAIKNNTMAPSIELIVFGLNQKPIFDFSRPPTQLTRIRNCTTTYEKRTKNDFSTAQRLKTHLCEYKEHSYVYDNNQKQFFFFLNLRKANATKKISQFKFLMSLRVKTKLCGQATIGNENSYMYHQVQKLLLKFSNR